MSSLSCPQCERLGAEVAMLRAQLRAAEDRVVMRVREEQAWFMDYCDGLTRWDKGYQRDAGWLGALDKIVSALRARSAEEGK